MKRPIKLNEILTEFNFDNVKEIMTILGWEWKRLNRTPTIYELIFTVEDLYYSLDEHNTDHVETGGFELTRYKTDDGYNYTLRFVVERWDTD